MKTDQVRILHVVGGMNRGGVETWLMHVLRHIDRTRYQMDFLVHTTEPCAYDDEIRALGSKIIPCMHPSVPLKYAQNLSMILKDGQYDVVHSHVHHYSGWVLFISRLAGVPVRIAHSHNDTTEIQRASSINRKAYFSIMRQFIKMHSTIEISASQKASTALFGQKRQKHISHKLLYYGIALCAFEANVADSARREFSIPDDTFVIGHVGRFDPQKNHTFLLDIFRQIHKVDDTAYLLLVGDGKLRADIERKASEAGIANYIIFAGLRDDVARLMLGAMDCFLFPSFYEGLGIVLIEAQAAGLPCVYSDVIPEEVNIVSELMHPQSLDSPAEVWAKAVIACQQNPPAISPADSLSRVKQSHFNVTESVKHLTKIYDELSG